MQTRQPTTPLITVETIQNVPNYRQRFLTADPFKHVIIDNFFNGSFARELLEEFPSLGERGETEGHGGTSSAEATVQYLRDLARAYEAADGVFSSQEFLQWTEDLSGIKDLLYLRESFWTRISPRFGYGTHENCDGEEQLAHVDFEYDSTSRYRRRLGLIVFFNEGWQRDWGGLIQLHSHPHDAQRNAIKSYVPAFNRCIVFETHQTSWHGFDKITLPPTRPNTSRKSLAIYLYTRETSETAMARPARLARYRTGTRASMGLGLPLLGYVRQIGDPFGFYPDGFMGNELRFSVQAVRPVSAFSLSAYIPEHLPANTQIEIWAGERLLFAGPAKSATMFSATAVLSMEAGSTHTLSIETSGHFVPCDLGVNEDTRNLSLLIQEITFEHAAES